MSGGCWRRWPCTCRCRPKTCWSRSSTAGAWAAFKPVLLKQDIGRDVLAVVEARGWTYRVSVQVRLRRNYLDGMSAAHVIGYLGEVSLEELKSGDHPGLRSGDAIGKFGWNEPMTTICGAKPGGGR